MKHDEFIAGIDSNQLAWGVTALHKAIAITLGWRGLCRLLIVWVFLLLPIAIGSFWAISSNRLPLLLWGASGLGGLLSGRPRLLLLDGLPWLLLLLVGGFLGIFFGPAHLLGGCLGLTYWFLSGMIRGVAIGFLGGELRESRAAFEKLQERGLLVVRRGI